MYSRHYYCLLDCRGAGNLFFPAQFEHEISTTMPRCDFMAYPLSPTHAIPHALAMLPAAAEDVTEEELMYDGKMNRLWIEILNVLV
jgi:hypothetical protein